MGTAESLRHGLRLLASNSKRPGLQAALVYLIVAPSASVVSSLVGSLSEYRFPHPLLTTVLHLSISLLALVGLSLLAQALLPLLPSSRRLLSTPRPSSTSSTSLSSLTPRALLLSLASNLPTRRSLLNSLTPYTLSSSLLTILLSLIELRATRITESPFWTLARLLPLPLVLLVSSAQGRGRGMIVWAVLVAGPAVGWKASAEGMLCGVSYAACLAGWVLAARKGFEEGEKEEEHVRSSPTILVHLLLCTLLLLPPLVLSQEISNAASSGHFGFFTEVGFWLQEIVMALAGLASLGGFWGLLKHLDPPTIFIVVGLKDFLLPFLFSFLLGNPLPSKAMTGSKLSDLQQIFALLALGAYHLADSWPQAATTSAEQGEGRAKEG
ncbi:hypothetical protein BCR35DRAFT_300565 [Leucosporidium creatinivorum]|uniref:Uncharacterized protein n=1 Tax=Leucosporidium creatinivorum TaxID=106004 RepID=A0A1Y2FZ78_9BASI|nr:hypothetical protein BCR35DRAFT_300565 [Leucosporidium creatinivorum]